MYSRWRKDIWFWQGEQAENVFCVFILTSRFADFICLWLFVLSNSNNLTDHVLLLNKNEYCMKYKIYRVKFPYISCMPTWALISILTYLTSMIPPVYYKLILIFYFYDYDKYCKEHHHMPVQLPFKSMYIVCINKFLEQPTTSIYV